jgi:hypothetical protein
MDAKISCKLDIMNPKYVYVIEILTFSSPVIIAASDEHPSAMICGV